MTGDVRRASGLFLVGALVLLAPALEGRTSGRLVAVATVAPFAVVAVVALGATRGPLFELFAHTGDRKSGRLYSLASFALAVTGLAVLHVGLGLPAAAFVAAVLAFTSGNLAHALIVRRTPDPAVGTSAFASGGGLGALAGMAVVGGLGGSAPGPALAVFVAASGALTGALVRSATYVRDDSLVIVSGGLVMWFLLDLGLDPAAERVAVGLAFTVALGYLAYGLGTASVTGMLTGVLLALFAVVLGGYGWFVLLVTFFGLGGLSSKYRYREKLERGIAQENEGARGGGNVLANSAVALIAVVAYAASGRAGLESVVFQFAFAGAVAAALADTFSSEFGGLFDEPRLITTLEPVEPGTDGGVTLPGAASGAAGAGIIAALGWYFFDLGPLETATILLAGVLGMTVDSILGATLEGHRLDNQSVNLFATLSAGIAAALAALAI